MKFTEAQLEDAIIRLLNEQADLYRHNDYFSKLLVHFYRLRIECLAKMRERL